MKSMQLMVAVGALLLPSPRTLGAGEGPASDAELAKLLPGRWRGVHTAKGGGMHHLVQVRKCGPGWAGQEVVWFQMTEKQAMAATMKRLNRRRLTSKAFV
jgi:hypothetical protein